MARIAYLLTQDRGGPVDVTTRLALAVADLGGHTVGIFGPPPARGGDSVRDVHHPIDVHRKGDLMARGRAREALRRWRPTIVHAQDRRAGLVVAGMQWLPGGPRAVLQTYHGVPDDVTEPWFRGVRGADGPSRYTRMVLAGDAAVAAASTRTVVPATAMGDFLHRRLRIPAGRIVHLDNGVVLPESTPPVGPVKRLLFVGLLVERKGLVDLLTALQHPGVLRDGVTLTVVGDGPARPAAERLAASPTLAGRVEFLGFRTDVPDLLAAHDALVLPSRMEQQPLVVAEAMGAGKPVLATDTGGVAEMLDVPGHQYLARPGDVESIAVALGRLLADPEPGRLGRALASRARRLYSVERSAAAHLEFYATLT
ncbi:glycosyltransferase family 4 protein [Rhodococcus sp. IEGM 1408]|uniref:glycosyltransferase family 4 protein n=1 Tax=Rhodococcus sp. IEGM 1408 TaxID=3082220 RepID=UPI002952ED8A|nr:glycosyltransferase family 4 protein [Rhodococcus sp. IEGM 1408]MDV8002537.1 glycosyltransferase family 4 protein [Rhodococcus sp. IEGM 1408]